MTASVLLIHFLGLIGPAWGTALIFVLISRVVWLRCRWHLGLLENWIFSSLIGSMVLAIALVLSSEDGTMLGYGSLIFTLAIVQFCLLKRSD